MLSATSPSNKQREYNKGEVQVCPVTVCPLFWGRYISCFRVSGNRPIQWFRHKEVMSVMLILHQSQPHNGQYLVIVHVNLNYIIIKTVKQSFNLSE